MKVTIAVVRIGISVPHIGNCGLSLIAFLAGFVERNGARLGRLVGFRR
jgi:hypothetical protein